MAERRDEGLCEQLDRELNWRLESEPVPSPVWHYTDERGLRGILGHREVWLTDYGHVNDPTELVFGQKAVFDEITRLVAELPTSDLGTLALREFLGLHDGSKLTSRGGIFIASFSHFGDRLSQWREYAAKGAGYSIGLRTLPTPANDDPSADLGLSTVSLEYVETKFRETVKRRFLSMLEGFQLYQRIHGAKHEAALYGTFVACEQRLAAGLALTTKHPTFFEETECRMFAVAIHKERPGVIFERTRDNGEVIPYVKVALAAPGDRVPIDRIIVGPLGDRAARRGVAIELLRSLGYPDADALVTDSTCVLK